MKPVHWIASSLRDLKGMPEDVRSEAGFSIWMAQNGDKATNAVPLVGFGSAKVVEIVIDEDRNSYRAIYTVKFTKAVYVLHAFQKKSKRGIATPKHELELIRSRLKDAELHYRKNYEQKKQRGVANDRA